MKTDRGEGHLELIARPTPEPAPGWVRIAVIYAGICGTDLHIVHDRFPSWPPAWEPAIGILAATGTALEAMTTVFPLEDWAAAFDAVAARTVIKGLLEPPAT